MAIREVIIGLGVVGFGGFGGFVISNLVLLSQTLNLQQELNTRLPVGEKFEPTFWWWGTRERFWELQQRFLPGTSRLAIIRRWRFIRAGCIALIVMCLLASISTNDIR